MRLWTIILALLTPHKNECVSKGTNLKEGDIGIPIKKYLKLKRQWSQDSRKHSSNKHSLHSAD